MNTSGTLIFFCGKMGAGKSTLAAHIAHERGAVFISEDDWLAALFSGEIQNFNDYIKYASRLKSVIGPHVQQLLLAGLTVVMDFPGNTRKQRAWFRDLCLTQAIPHELVYLAADDEVCLTQLEQRRQEQPERAHFDTEDVFRMVTAYFEPPADSEGFNVVLKKQGTA